MKNLTVIIPHFNDVDRLERLIKTIPDTNDIEIIVVDDRSTVNIKERFQCRDNVKIYINQKKKGAGTCRNLGLSKAKGKWVIFADSDDYFEKDSFYYIAQRFKSDSDLIYFKANSFYEGTLNKSIRHESINNIIDNDLISAKYRSLTPWCKMINMNLLSKNNILFDEQIVANDIMFSARLSDYVKKVDKIDRKLYKISDSPGSLTRTSSKERLRIRYETEISLNEFYAERSLHKYQHSVISLLLLYWCVINYNDFKFLLSQCFKRNFVFVHKKKLTFKKLKKAMKNKIA